MPFCPRCGRYSEGQFCIDCGARITESASTPGPVQKKTWSSIVLILMSVIALSAGLAISPYIVPPRIQPIVELSTITVPSATTSTVSGTITSVTTFTTSVTVTSTKATAYSSTSLLHSSSTSTYVMTTYYQTQTSQNRQGCDPSYPTVCIPPPPPDLDCKDIPYRNFVVLPPDPHHFDGDHDGIGCET
jgi:hypothetical protein